MGHGDHSSSADDVDRHAERDLRPAARLNHATAEKIATTLQALATPSRLLILSELRDGPRPVTELAATIGMEQSAVSHQLRILRNLGLVTRIRDGRNSIYSLYDDHVARLLEESAYHVEHLHLGLAKRFDS